MRLLRYGYEGYEKPAILDAAGRVRDISSLIHDIDPDTINAGLIEKIRSSDANSFPVVTGSFRIGPPVGNIGKVVCVGFNSRLHTEELGFKQMASDELVVFLKPVSAVCGPNDAILYSKIAKKLDWEAELGVVIGKRGKYIKKESAGEYILGYTCINDLTDRYWQFEKDDKQYTKGKGFDTFSPIGPYIVTSDDVADPGKLNIRLWVNGEKRQDFDTSDYIHGPSDVVSYLSQFFTLMPGDVIAMGSAPGNARSWGDDKFLKPGDCIRLEISTVGIQENRVAKE